MAADSSSNGCKPCAALTLTADTACDILAELSPDLTVFCNAARLAAWAGVCPGNHESTGKRKPAGVRCGTRHLAVIPNQCARAAARTKECQFHGYHKAVTIRRGYKRAFVATPRAGCVSLKRSATCRKARWSGKLRNRAYLNCRSSGDGQLATASRSKRQPSSQTHMATF